MNLTPDKIPETLEEVTQTVVSMLLADVELLFKCGVSGFAIEENGVRVSLEKDSKDRIIIERWPLGD